MPIDGEYSSTIVDLRNATVKIVLDICFLSGRAPVADSVQEKGNSKFQPISTSTSVYFVALTNSLSIAYKLFLNVGFS